MAVASVVIPAHNEAASIGRSLRTLRIGVGDDDLDVVVVCNGCTDGTADVARRADPRARVIEIPQPSKSEAVQVGNAATDVFPRVHLDADIELTGAAVLELLEPITRGRALAAAPQRVLARTGCSSWVRWYYDVWEALPQVQGGLFGRGVVALSAAGQERVSRLPRLMSDDLGLSDAFSPHERRVVPGAVAVIHPPRTMSDLLRRRVRVATGNVQAGRLGARRESSRTRLRTLLGLAVARPVLATRLPVFVGVYVVARLMARRAIHAGDFHTWQRDESSRARD
jgi:glycosyltransferase involved in cell wall biosynthesis